MNRICAGAAASWAFGVCATLAAGQEAGGTRPIVPVPHIRPAGPRAAHTLAQGLALSPTLRALADRLERSDLIAYIAIRPRAAGPGAYIQFFSAGGSFRFVRIVLRADLTTPQMISLLGHELQHALEVADQADIRDRGSFERYYARLGLHSADPGTVDTKAAIAVGERIRQELGLSTGWPRF